MSKTRPSETIADAANLIEKCYNLRATKVTELVSFECKNFAVEAVPLPSHVHEDGKLTNSGDKTMESFAGEKSESYQSVEKLVLKIFNNELCTPEDLPRTRQQIIYSQLLCQRGFLCPKVLYTSDGELFAKSDSGRYAMLMRMLPGQQLGADTSKITATVLYELGILMASLHITLQDSDPSYLDIDPTNPWTIENIHLLSDYLYCIKDDEERRMLGNIIARFQQIRDSQFDQLQKGIIHGDLHDYNLIVDFTTADARLASQTPSRISLPSSQQQQQRSIPPNPQLQSVLQKYGIIDFEEMAFSYPVLELSRMISDMMMDCESVELLDIGGHILAGYLSVDNTSVTQYQFCLYDTVLANLAQIIVLSIHEHQAQGQSNDYCLLGTEACRAVLDKLKDVEAADVHRAWGDVLTQYGMENIFIR